MGSSEICFSGEICRLMDSLFNRLDYLPQNQTITEVRMNIHHDISMTSYIFLRSSTVLTKKSSKILNTLSVTIDF